ncbi:hypothetical protein ACCO45_007065 [Purpureocillium lilacinum]|uniref:Uncharacterized protein n=1 Tax=Purpureocillium lilacinum TaxID=33203 RepID=A0ACC4DS28_PURLI
MQRSIHPFPSIPPLRPHLEPLRSFACTADIRPAAAAPRGTASRSSRIATKFDDDDDNDDVVAVTASLAASPIRQRERGGPLSPAASQRPGRHVTQKPCNRSDPRRSFCSPALVQHGGFVAFVARCVSLCCRATCSGAEFSSSTASAACVANGDAAMDSQPGASHDMDLPRSAHLTTSSPRDTLESAAMDAPVPADATLAQSAALVPNGEAAVAARQTPAALSDVGASGDGGPVTVVDAGAGSETDTSIVAAQVSQSASDRPTSAVPDRDSESWVAPRQPYRPRPPGRLQRQPQSQLQVQPQPNPTSISSARTLSTPSDTPPSASTPTESRPAASEQKHHETAVSMGVVASKPAGIEPSRADHDRDERDTAQAVVPQCPSPAAPTAGSPASDYGAHGGLVTPPEQEPVASDDNFHIEYDYDDVQGHRILRLKPTTAQWDDFPAVLAYARKLGAQGDSCFKAVPANAYRVKQIRKTTFWQVSTVPSDGEFSSSNTGPEFTGSVDAAFKSLRRLFRTNKDRQMRNVRYRVDVPAWTPKQRLEAGVPERSPLHPLKGDKLDHTKAVIPGIHTPYVYESGPYFGATFQIHAEDFRLASLNHLYKGRKIWIVIPSTAVDVAEKALGRGTGCSQFMRHRAEFFFPDKLDKLGIPYRLVDQRPGETIVILPDAYHEGFSTGYTIAEAKNYADASWNTDTYQPCDATCKLVTAIPAAFMRPLEEGEARLDLCAAYGDDGKLKPLEIPQKRPHDALDDGVDAIAVAPFVSKSMQAVALGEPDLKRVKV